MRAKRLYLCTKAISRKWTESERGGGVGADGWGEKKAIEQFMSKWQTFVPMKMYGACQSVFHVYLALCVFRHRSIQTNSFHQIWIQIAFTQSDYHSCFFPSFSHSLTLAVSRLVSFILSHVFMFMFTFILSNITRPQCDLDILCWSKFMWKLKCIHFP